jgi:hypothetical protein
MMARGKWIAPHNDDDIYTPDHIEVLLRFAQKNNLEFVYGKRSLEIEPGKWIDRGEAPFSSKITPWPATLQRTYVSRVFKSDIEAWKIEFPGDKHMAWRMYKAGVRAGFLDRVVAYAPKRPGQILHGSAAEDRPDNKPKT